MLNIQCKDCTFLGIYTDRDSTSGCPTCDYGSTYVNYITYEFNVGDINLKLKDMYDYPISEGDLMMFWLNNIDKIKQMSFDEICTYLDKHHIRGYETCDVQFEVKKWA